MSDPTARTSSSTRNGSSRSSTLGPVADLERPLPPDWWRTIFNATYLRTDGDVVENAANTTTDVTQLIAATSLEPQSRVLDLCCGQGRHAIELARRGYSLVTGLDRSRYLINLARRRTQDAGFSVAFHQGDARRFRLRETPFDVVAVLGNSFGYFDRADDDRAVLNSVRKALRPGGMVYLDVSDGAWLRANFEPRSWEWIDRDQLVCRERALSADGTRLVCREVVIDASRGVIADQFYAQRLYDSDKLSDLLAMSGFDDLCDHASTPTASQRDQDIGLMEHRFCLSARAVEVPVSRLFPRPQTADVLVLLGDPRRDDGLRPGGTFTSEDNDALGRLRTALATLPGQSFRYHDDHSTLLAALAARRPALVFNLCDEGFGNDLRAELHVPALLDLLGIPYTGAGPACLGLCVDKSHVRAIALGLGVPVPREICVSATMLDLAAVEVSYPAIVKPRIGDGSLGIDQRSVVHDSVEMHARVTSLRSERPGEAILVQEFLPGTEYSIGVVGNPGIDLEVLTVLEVDYRELPSELPRILGYESKWNSPQTPYWTHVHYRRASLSDAQQADLHAWSMTLFEQLGCRDYARFDFRADRDGTIRLLEANPNPGWGWGDEMNYMADWSGITYPQLLARILTAARARVARKR